MTDEERCKVAARLRWIDAKDDPGNTALMLDKIRRAIGVHMNAPSVFPPYEWLVTYAHVTLNRLADLIDPTEHERTVADNLKIIDRNRELERELVRVKRKLERTRSASCIDHERAVLADKLEDENLELKKRLGCFDDVTPPVSWYASMRDRCERLERELVEAYRRQND